VDSTVRRSSGVRANSNGFKVNTCTAKNCLGCSADIPTLTPQTLKKIGTSLCHLQEDKLGEEALMKKKKLEPVGKKVKKSKKDKEDEDVNDTNKDDN